MMAAVGFLIGFIVWIVWSFLGLLALFSYIEEQHKLSTSDHLFFWIFITLGLGYTDWIFGWGWLN